MDDADPVQVGEARGGARRVPESSEEGTGGRGGLEGGGRRGRGSNAEAAAIDRALRRAPYAFESSRDPALPRCAGAGRHRSGILGPAPACLLHGRPVCLTAVSPPLSLRASAPAPAPPRLTHSPFSNLPCA